MLLRFALVAGLSVVALAACSKRTLPPGGEGICWNVTRTSDGELKYHKLKTYKGSFIFVERRGIFTAPSMEEHPYLALVRTGDGRLAIPGAMPQQPAP